MGESRSCEVHLWETLRDFQIRGGEITKWNTLNDCEGVF